MKFQYLKKTCVKNSKFKLNDNVTQISLNNSIIEFE